MGIQFEWQAGNDQGDWQTIASAGRGPRRRGSKRPRRWVCIALLAGVALLAAGGCLVVRNRYHRARREIAFQIQGVIDLEALALEQRDAERLLAQQDQGAKTWVGRQQRRIEACISGRAQADPPLDPSYCASLGPAQVHEVDMHGEVAWVEVSQEDSSGPSTVFQVAPSQL